MYLLLKLFYAFVLSSVVNGRRAFPSSDGLLLLQKPTSFETPRLLSARPDSIVGGGRLHLWPDIVLERGRCTPSRNDPDSRTPLKGMQSRGPFCRGFEA